MGSDRRVFVLAASGEVGPFSPDELRREIAAGRLHRADQTRTAAGKVLGTVGDLVGGPHAQVSGRMPVSGSSSTSARQRVESRKLTVPVAQPRTRPWLVPTVIAGLAGVLLVAVVLLRAPASAASASSAEAVQTLVPMMRVAAIADHADATSGAAGVVRFSTDTAPTTDVVLRIQVSGTARAGEFQPLPSEIVMAAGRTSVDVQVIAKPASSTATVAHQVVVRLLPGTGYQLGGGIHAEVTLAISLAPTTAVEDFSPRDPYVGPGASNGWSGPWSGTGMVFLPGPLSGKLAGPGHARVPSIPQTRKLLKRFSTGTVWLSYRANAPSGEAVAPQVTYTPWNILGPIPVTSGAAGFATSLIDETHVDLAQPQRGLSWIAHPEWRDGVVHEFNDSVSAYYLYRTVTATEVGSLPVVIGSDDTLEVWLNGVGLWRNEVNRGVGSNPDRITLPLKAGANTLLLKVVNNGGGSGFIYREPGFLSGVMLLDGAQEMALIGCSPVRRGVGVTWCANPEEQYVLAPTARLTNGTRVVVRLSTADHTDVDIWIDPPGGQPGAPTAAGRISPVTCDAVRLMVGQGLSWEVSDLRVGATWDDVVPR